MRTGLADLVHRNEITPTELVDAAIARAEATRPDINAIATPLYEAARARAKTVDRQLPLAGVPFALKDLGIGIKACRSMAAAALRLSPPISTR